MDKNVEKKLEALCNKAGSECVQLSKIDAELLNDKECVIYLINNANLDSDFFKKLPESLKNDKEIVINALIHSLVSFDDINPSLLDDKDVALALVSMNGYLLNNLSDSLKNDKEVVLTAVSKYANPIIYASEELRANKDVVLYAVSHPMFTGYPKPSNDDYYKYAFAPTLQDDREIALAAVRHGGPYHNFPSHLKEDPDIALAVLHINLERVMNLPKQVYENKDFVLKAIDDWFLCPHNIDPLATLRDFVGILPVSMLGDKDVALKLVKTLPYSFTKLTYGLKNDKDVVLETVKNSPYYIRNANYRLRNDDEVIREAARKEIINVPYASFVMQDDEYYIQYKYTADQAIKDFERDNFLTISALKSSGIPTLVDDYRKSMGMDDVKDVDKLIKVDEDFIVEALTNDSLIRERNKIDMAMLRDNNSKISKAYHLSQYHIEDYRNSRTLDKGQVCYALEHHQIYGETREAVIKLYGDDIDIALIMLRKDGYYKDKIPPVMKSNKTFALEALKIDPSVYQRLNNELRRDIDVIKLAIQCEPSNYTELLNDDKNNKEIVLYALSVSGELLSYVDKKIAKDEDVIKAALDNNPSAFMYAPVSYRKNRELVLEGVKRNGLAYRYAANQLKEDREILLAAVNNNGLALQYAPEKYKRDKEVVLLAAKNNPKALQYAYGALQLDADIQNIVKDK